ncbi:MAG: alkaline phosphatase family protein [Acidobacteria bacterium]|nr:alkaline phosphatase family protein [Acidobacteriota bacterium]
MKARLIPTRFGRQKGWGQATAALLLVLTAARCGRKDDRTGATAAAVNTPNSGESADVAVRDHRPAAGGRAPVLWLGMDGLDWEILDRLAADGTMPNWKRLASEGATARLTSFVPIISPILWTTAATGVAPDVHRVLDFQETDPKTGAKVPISGLSRAVPAVWNLASQAGRRVGVVGWWATHPAEEVNGFFVSDHTSPILFDRLPLAGAAYPASLESGIAQVQAREGRVSDADLARFVDIPAAQIATARVGSGGLENPIVALSRILSATRVSHRIARDLYDRDRPDLLALYLEGTDEVGHVFAASTPPKLACASDADIARYGNVVARYYGDVDRLLGQWMRRASEDGATLIVHSDHGFKWGADRPCGLASGNWSTAAFWHRLDGVLAVWGARAQPGPRGQASLFDVAPTVLSLLDLPADRRMTGRAARFAFRELMSPASADLFRGVEVRRVAAAPMTPGEANEYAKKLLALGYLTGGETRPLAPTGGDRPGMTEGAWNNLGLYLRDTASKPGESRAAFEKALALRPDYYAPMYNLAVLARGEGRTKAAEDWLFQALAAIGDAPEKAVLGWSHEYQHAGKAAAARSLLERAAAKYPKSEEIARDLALLLARSRDCREAQTVLGRFDPGSIDPRTYNTLALVETCLENRPAVVRLLTRSLEMKPDQPEVARSLSLARGEKPPSP